jgi:predicted Zn-dependent protease
MKRTYQMLSILVFVTLLIPMVTLTSLSAPEKEKITCRVFITYENNNAMDPEEIEKLATGGCWATFSKWTTPPINYVVNPTNSEGFSQTYVVNTVKTAAETWDAKTSVELFGNTPTVNIKAKIGVRDGKNVVGFGNLQSGIIAATYLWGTSSAIVEWDMKFNSRLVWGDASSNPNVFDFLGIACHEYGHTFGMDDIYTSSCSSVTMYGYGAPGQTFQRTLESADIEGLHYLYGA